MVALAETNFASSPPDIHEELVALAQSTTSYVCERGFKNLSHNESEHVAGFLGRQARWHRLLAGPLLSDFDYKQSPALPEFRHAGARKIDKIAFDFKEGSEFSLGEEYVQGLMSQDNCGDSASGSQFTVPRENFHFI